jgi:hypothetical protein
MVPNSLKHIEFLSKNTFQHRHITRTPKLKDEIIEDLHKNHIKSQNSCNIVILPKSPFGKHKSYNDEENFYSKHFVFEESPDSPKSLIIQKKIGLLNKRMNKRGKSHLSRVKDEDNQESYQSEGGKLFCIKPKPLIEIYQDECERYKAFNLKMKEEANSRREKSPEYFIGGIFERLSIKKKSREDVYKKWENLFDSKVLGIN